MENVLTVGFIIIGQNSVHRKERVLVFSSYVHVFIDVS